MMTRAGMTISVALWLAGGEGGAPAPRTPTAPARVMIAPPASSSESSGAAPPEYRLERAKGKSGDLIYDATAFRGRIARDGTVTFDDKHIGALDLLPFLPGPPPQNVPTLEGTIRSLRRTGRAPKPPASAEPTADETRWPESTVSRHRPDAREDCHYPRSCFFDARVVLLGVKVNLDISDAILRLHGSDPYRYQKARFLTATREMRLRMAARAHREDLERSAAELPRRLRDIACDQSQPVSERRAVLEGLRADLEEGAVASSREELRRQVDRWLATDGGVACGDGP